VSVWIIVLLFAPRYDAAAIDHFGQYASFDDCDKAVVEMLKQHDESSFGRFSADSMLAYCVRSEVKP
jgi:hypothetical protein